MISARRLRLLSMLMGIKSRAFMIGWADGVTRWELGLYRPGGVLLGNPLCYYAPHDFEGGSVEAAASDGALAYLIGLDADPRRSTSTKIGV